MDTNAIPVLDGWISTDEAAGMLGISRRGVNWLINNDHFAMNDLRRLNMTDVRFVILLRRSAVAAKARDKGLISAA